MRLKGQGNSLLLLLAVAAAAVADSIECLTAPGTSYRYGFLKKGGTEEARRA